MISTSSLNSFIEVVIVNVKEISCNQSINQYELYLEMNITENIKIFLQLYMIMMDLLTCRQDLAMGGCYLIILT